MLTFTPDGAGQISTTIGEIIVAGMTARDEAAIRHHLDEMKRLGVRMPNTFPFFFRLSASTLTQAERIQVLGTDSSGEVEPVVVAFGEELWLTLGSDHTDRKVEAYSINVSKQMCPHPIGTQLWRFADVAPHWDRLVIRSWTTRNGKRELYQEGPLALMRHPDDLMQRYANDGGLIIPGTAMYCGTIGAMGPLAHADVFEMELADPVLDRRMTHRYAVEALPVLT
jgi:Protein of unknown function (DUF2848)